MRGPLGHLPRSRRAALAGASGDKNRSGPLTSAVPHLAPHAPRRCRSSPRPAPPSSPRQPLDPGGLVPLDIVDVEFAAQLAEALARKDPQQVLQARLLRDRQRVKEKCTSVGGQQVEDVPLGRHARIAAEDGTPRGDPESRSTSDVASTSPGYRSYGRPPGLTGDAGGERTALCALVLSRGPENRSASAYKSCRNSSGEMRASFKILVSNLGP